MEVTMKSSWIEFKYTEDRKHVDLVNPNIAARWEVQPTGKFTSRLKLVEYSDEFSSAFDVVRASAKISLEAARWHRRQQLRQQKLRELANELQAEREEEEAIEDERRHNASLRWPS